MPDFLAVRVPKAFAHCLLQSVKTSRSRVYHRAMPRPRLYFGPYSTPLYQIGDTVFCERQGYVQIVGTSNGRIPWPLGRPRGKRGHSALVLYGDLTKAVRQETGVAIKYWWGCGISTVDAMRKAIGVSGFNRGGLIRQREVAMSPACVRGREKARSVAGSPERRAKIAKAKLGVKRSPVTVGKMREANLGKRASSSTRKKMSQAHRARGTRPPWLNSAWSPADDELVRTLPAAEVAVRTGRSLTAVYNRRSVLKVPDGRRR